MTEEDYLRADAKTLTKEVQRLAKERDSHSAKIRLIDGEFERRKAFTQGVIDSLESTVTSHQKAIKTLQEEEKELRSKVEGLKARMDDMYATYAEVSKKLALDIAERSKNVSSLEEQITALATQKNVAQGALDSILELKGLVSRETDSLLVVISDRKKELGDVHDKIRIKKVELSDSEKKVKENRETVLINKKEREELAVKRHDLHVLELRLEPKFQAILHKHLMGEKVE